MLSQNHCAETAMVLKLFFSSSTAIGFCLTHAKLFVLIRPGAMCWVFLQYNIILINNKIICLVHNVCTNYATASSTAEYIKGGYIKYKYIFNIIMQFWLHYHFIRDDGRFVEQLTFCKVVCNDNRDWNSFSYFYQLFQWMDRSIVFCRAMAFFRFLKLTNYRVNIMPIRRKYLNSPKFFCTPFNMN
jgi:hypothetical protein